MAGQGSRRGGKGCTLHGISPPTHLSNFSEERSADPSLLEIQLVATEKVRILNPMFLFFPQVSIFSFVAKGLVLNSNNDFFLEQLQ